MEQKLISLMGKNYSYPLKKFRWQVALLSMICFQELLKVPVKRLSMQFEMVLIQAKLTKKLFSVFVVPNGLTMKMGS
ncbi:Uncharacterised protein [Acinetobacter baumannii]|nr:Uncharacterised protein [Acinetobacter baumannii]SVK54846.1 Uncharacterised protein [Acinetobacter baumannii]